MRAGDWEMDAGMLDALGLEDEAPHSRVPTELEDSLHESARPRHRDVNYAANAEGARRLIALAEAELTAEERAAVDEATLAGQPQEAFDALPERERLIRRAEAISERVPRLALGDPATYDVGARGTDDVDHIATTVAAATEILSSITGGARDADLIQVFGAANAATAKQRYANAAAALQRLHATDQIRTDRSGTLRVMGAGGFTRGSRSIMMEEQYIDTPSHLSTIGLLHEAMHAGNPGLVTDRGYIESPLFTQLPEATKLDNSAHYEVIPRRILGLPYAYEGVTFTPATSTTPEGARQQAVREASERLRNAWTMALNLHVQYMNLHQRPTLWWAPQGAGTFREGMPYWSKVEKLTIHQKAEISPMSSDPALHPVSQIDLALSEAMTGRLARCQDLLDDITDATLAELATHATAAELAAAEANPVVHRELWISIALRRSGPITGAEARDLRVIHELAELRAAFDTAWRYRDPGSFPD